MLYYTSNEYKICSKIVSYTAYGKPHRKYTNDRDWWEKFISKWGHHQDLMFENVEPTSAQLVRLEEINALEVPEIYLSDASQYVEMGIVNPDNPALSGLTQNIDLSNTLQKWKYEQLVTELIQSEVDAYNKANGMAFRDVHSCKNYAGVQDYTHQPFCAAVWAWNVSVWESARQILRDVATGVIELPNEDEFVGMLPVFTQ